MTAAIVLFAGPTLRADDMPAAAGIAVLPPVSQGDVYEATRDRPWGIGIVDGYFEAVPAVWHKEILWALHQGVHVFGAASMGALRAAELHTFGMIGIGRIFEAFRDGLLTDDDEVAVRHGPADSGFRAMSEAMVNLRATVDAALAQGIVGADTAEVLLALGKGVFYAERTWPGLLDAAAGRVAAGELQALRAWLPAGRIDQKRADAIALVAAMVDERAATPAPFRPAFHFERTDMWEQVGRAAGRRRGATADAVATESLLLDEVRLEGMASFDGVATRAFARALGLEAAAREGIGDPGPPAPALAARVPAQLVRDEAKLVQVRRLYADDIARGVPDVLAIDGRLAELEARAHDKARLLAGHRSGGPLPGPEELGGSGGDERLVSWYFTERLGIAVPDDLDAYAARLGCADRDAFLRLLAREWWFLRLSAGG